MIKDFKTFENWKNNIIDDNLFSSGRAKYNPTVLNGTIYYQTGESEPYYFATISQKGNSFICKIYKKKKNGDEIRLRNKLQDTLKISHNYVREFLNQKLKKDKKKRSKDKDKDKENKIERPEETMTPTQFEMPLPPPPPPPPKSRAVIHRF